MRKTFVQTQNYMKFTDGIHIVESRGASEAGMMLVYGLPGSGKSQVVSRWATEAKTALRGGRSGVVARP